MIQAQSNFLSLSRNKKLTLSDHCLGTLKSFAMCHGDVGMVIYSWQKDRLKPGANGTGHTCVNWDKISQWTKERTVDMYKPGLLVHPQHGESGIYCRSFPEI